MSFTWVPFYKALAIKLLDYRDHQGELLSFLADLRKQGCPVVRLRDQYPDKNHEVPVDEMDPFTFFANFNRGITTENRQKILKAAKTKFDISAEVPSDFTGIPVADNMRSWFFGWKYNRGDQVPILWDLAASITKGGPEKLNPDLYEKAATLKGRGPGMMTMGLFWLNPDEYLALDKVMLNFLTKSGVAVDKKQARSLEGYRNIINSVRKQFPNPFYELSHEAWLDKGGTPVIPGNEKPQPPQPETESMDSRPKYWIYAPGPQAKYWSECQNQGIMVWGGDKLASLKDFESQEELAQALKAAYDRKKEPIMDSLAAWQFTHIVQNGDIIIPKRGRRAYLGYGIVTGNYQYDPTRAEYKHIRKVAWKKAGEWAETEQAIVLKTLTDVTKYPEYVERIKNLIGIEQVQTQISCDLALNTILYGPPGTGKTYQLKNEYFEKFTDVETQTLEDFIAELAERLAWWEVVTTVMLDLGKARVTQLLQHPLMQAKISASQNRHARAAIWAQLQTHTKNECEHVKYSRRSDPLLFTKDDQSIWSIDIELAKQEVPELEGILQRYKRFQPKKKIEKRYIFTTFHQSYSYEDFIEGIKPVLVDDAEESVDERKEIAYKVEPGIFHRISTLATKNPGKTYAIFIDEINRGNIASIFGELITLIEEDKRKGAKNELIARLPYSREEFAVPGNLYIMGTMNTADRSVDALDTALRRRFSFVEMLPQPELIKQPPGLDVDLQQILKTLNARIEKLLDKDHCIGHAYFMTITEEEGALEQLKRIFANKILPLLEEYFYNDPVKLGMVLGSAFVKRKDIKIGLAAGEWDFDEFEERDVYEIADPLRLDANDFKSIYE